MNSTVLKILKTIASVSVAFISFTIIVIIAFYFYLSDGVEFNLNKSNQTLSSLTNRFELDFSKNSSIYFKAREERTSEADKGDKEVNQKSRGRAKVYQSY